MVNITNEIKSFLLRNCTIDEKHDYISWINGNKTHQSWIEKALEQREKIILLQPSCNICEILNSPINIYETGYCRCLKNHNCEKVILDIILEIDNTTI